MARILDQLEQHGDVERLAHQSPDDGRATLLRLTDRGRQVERDLVAAVVSAFDETHGSLDRALASLTSAEDPLPPSGRIASAVVSESSVTLALGRIGGILVEILTSELDDIESNAALALCLLHGADAPLRLIAVSTQLGLSTGCTSKLLERMEASGFVQRSHGTFAEDRRGVAISMTPSGHGRLALIATRILDRAHVILDAFRLLEDLLDETPR